MPIATADRPTDDPTRTTARPGPAFFTRTDDDPATPERTGPTPTLEPGDRRPRRARRGGVLVVLAGIAATLLAVLSQSSAQADPTANQWYRLRMCESSNNYSINTGNGYYGAYQFNLATWQSVGGSGYPNQASPAEQDSRALTLWHERGWQPWTCAYILGFIGSGGGGGNGGGGGGGGTQSTPHGWPGVRYSLGDDSSGVATFQRQMNKRGASDLHGTGEFGPNTLAVVKALQVANHRSPSGIIGPITWELAWTGSYNGVSGSGASSHPVSAHAWPGHTYRLGDDNAQIGVWQRRMHARGASDLHGTGEFGPNTLAVIKKLQAQNHMRPSGVLGKRTWELAWTGTYH